MHQYKTIKDLVIDAYLSKGSMPEYDELTTLVLENFPNSKWKKTHYAWYKTQIKTGKIKIPELSDITNDSENEDTEAAVEEAVQATISLERDLHSYLASRLDQIETGLVLMPDGIEHQTKAGKIDLLARDNNGHHVVIELRNVCITHPAVCYAQAS